MNAYTTILAQTAQAAQDMSAAKMTLLRAQMRETRAMMAEDASAQAEAQHDIKIASKAAELATKRHAELKARQTRIEQSGDVEVAAASINYDPTPIA